jgi:hypothetical protein
VISDAEATAFRTYDEFATTKIMNNRTGELA